MGRYSLDHVGLIYAGGQWDLNEYNRFIPDKDGIIPISDDEYFEDDIVGLFVKFISIVYGEETLVQMAQTNGRFCGAKRPQGASLWPRGAAERPCLSDL